MVTKEFVKEFLISSLATVEVLLEIVPNETNIEKLKETIKFAGPLTIRWSRVLELAEKRLEIMEEVGRIVCQKAAMEPSRFGD